MESKWINPFTEALEYIFNQFQLSCHIHPPEKTDQPLTGKDVYSVVGVTGEMRGQVFIGYSKSTALQVISAMMGGMPIADIDEMGQSALAELSNMICGNAMTRFSMEQVNLDITPPSIVVGQQVRITLAKASFQSVKIEVAGYEPIDLIVGMST